MPRTELESSVIRSRTHSPILREQQVQHMRSGSQRARRLQAVRLHRVYLLETWQAARIRTGKY
jgi:hypothetical protein